MITQNDIQLPEKKSTPCSCYQPKAKSGMESPSLSSKESNSSSKNNEIEDFPLAKFMGFLKRIKLKKMLAKVKDPRDPKKTVHQIEIILSWVLSVFFLDLGR